MSLGALTQVQLQQANATLADLGTRTAAMFDVVRRAREAGFDPAEVAQAEATHDRLIRQLDVFFGQVAGLSPADFDRWIASVRAFEAELSQLEATTLSRMRAAGKKRTTTIILATVGALAAAGVVAALIWYGTGGRKKRQRRRRRRRGVAGCGDCEPLPAPG